VGTSIKKGVTTSERADQGEPNGESTLPWTLLLAAADLREFQPFLYPTFSVRSKFAACDIHFRAG
jgi:hypothetical protein